MEAAAIAGNVVLFTGIFVLAGGYYWQDRRRHLLRMTGFLLFAVFFTSEVVRIVLEGKDAWNVTFTAAAPPLFIFVAWQEWLSYKWDEDHRSLRWLAGAAWMAALIYYTFDRIPQMTAGIVYVVAAQSVWVGQLFGYGYDFHVGSINWGHTPLSVNIDNAPVDIILGCTGIEAIVIFVGAILATQLERDPWAPYKEPNLPRYERYRRMSGDERRWRALLYTTSIIWVGNLVRNVLIIYLVDVKEWDFEFVHGDLGKGSSFVILLVLAFVTFNLIPEMLDNISGLVDAVKRKSPAEREREAKEEGTGTEGPSEEGGKDGEDGEAPPGEDSGEDEEGENGA